MLIDGMQGAAGAIHAGGDTGGALEGNLPTQEPLALFSGVVKLDDEGKAVGLVRSARFQRIGAADRRRVVEG